MCCRVDGFKVLDLGLASSSHRSCFYMLELVLLL